VRHDVAVQTFRDLADTAFADVVQRHGLAPVSAADSTWWADVRWGRSELSLRVSDDRRDRLIEVMIERPMTTEDLDVRPLSVANGRLAIPLWALAEAGGGSQKDVLAGGDQENRLSALPRLAEATERYAGALLDDDSSGVMNAYAVVARVQWENSEEGRKARRFLP